MTTLKSFATVVFAVSIALGTDPEGQPPDPAALGPTSAGQAGREQIPEKREPGLILTFEVVEKVDRSPLPEAIVWVRQSRSLTFAWETTTDEQGRCAIVSRGEAPAQIDVVVACAGHAPGYLGTGLHTGKIQMPLERAEAIGGAVHDEQGRPIEGARVFPMVHPWAQVWAEIYASPNSDVVAATTDAWGRWRCDALPAGTRPETQFRVLVSEMDHITEGFLTTAREARARSSVQVLRPGISVSGTVLSPFGRGVGGATVIVLRPPRDGTLLRLTTDKNGQFRSSRCLDPTLPGVVLLVQATALAWAAQHVAAAPEIPPQIIRLVPKQA